MYGGYALVACHELGLHLGESPKKIFSDGKVGRPSVEGQADYYATLKCLRRLFRNDDNESKIAGIEVPPVMKNKCSKNFKTSFKTSWEIAICIRTGSAGIAVSTISAEILNTQWPAVESPDPTQVDTTYEGHPIPFSRGNL